MGSFFKPAPMRSETECLALAEAMTLSADCCSTSTASATFLILAQGWREVAAQAKWQDAWAGDPAAQLTGAGR